MADNTDVRAFMDQYVSLARKCKREDRILMNHFCIRVEDIDAAEKLLTDSFGITGFVRPGGELFQGEGDLSVAWLNDEVYLEKLVRNARHVEVQIMGEVRDPGPGVRSREWLKVKARREQELVLIGFEPGQEVFDSGGRLGGFGLGGDDVEVVGARQP